jgi:hypothetical protein
VLILLIIFPCIQDPKLLAALQESRDRQAPYAGAFLLKDEPDSDPNVVSSSDTEKSVYDLKGKELFNRLHEVGTLAQVCDFVCGLIVALLPSTNYLFRFDKLPNFLSIILFSIPDFKYPWGSSDPDWSSTSAHNRYGRY